MCNKDCFNCPYDDCRNNDELTSVSDELDLEIRLERKRVKATNRYQRYSATKKGYEAKKRARRKYEKKNPEKTALWSFKSRTKREKGYTPSEEECRLFLIKRGYICG